MLDTFRHDAHPMGMMVSSIAAMSNLYPEVNPAFVGQDIYADKKTRNEQIHRLVGGVSSLAAAISRHRQGRFV